MNIHHDIHHSRKMDLEVEIPIWYNGKMKWISNLTTRSTCSDVIQAILSTDDNHYSQTNQEYILYESWRGVERPLKSRCRLLKLWNSWAGESQNVTLTLRTHQSQSTPTHFRIRQQDKKLEKLKRQLKRTDKQIEKFTNIENDNNQSISAYLNLYRSIINTQTQLEHQQKLISRLISDIENETRSDINQDDLKKILSDVNQTLIISRELTEQSEELDQKINKTNEDIDKKQCLLDELELDYALDQNIDIDSLDDGDDQDQLTFSFKEERVSTKDISPSPSPPQKIQTGI
jgi:predicted DNA binding protein